MPRHPPREPRVSLVQRRSIELARDVDQMVDRLPLLHRRVFAQRLRRATASINANIADALTRDDLGGRRRFLSIARASASELEAHLMVLRGYDVAAALEGMIERSREISGALLALSMGSVRR